MNRRSFFFTLPGLAAAAACGRQSPRITQVSVAPVECRFHKFVAMNSYDEAPKGETYGAALLRIATDRGVEGIGAAVGDTSSPDYTEALKGLLGANPLEIFERDDNGFIQGVSEPFAGLLTRHRHLDGPLLDLVGKLEEKPCWQLLGEPVKERIEVYDGTLYFSDVWFEDRGVQAVVDEAREAVASGYRGMKFKVGRGWKWMDRSEGLQRDIEVLKAVREALGPEAKILADANNGYREDFEGAWTFLSETKDVKLHWMEEIFPEDVEMYRQLRSKMSEAGIETLIADGESVREPEEFKPFLDPERLVDVLQIDIRRGGFLGCRQTARLGAPAGAVTVPHNWASQIGLFMSLHLAKAEPSVVAAEDDRSRCDAIVAAGYEFQNSHYTVPDSPGLGIRVNEQVYHEKYEAGEVVVS